MIESIGLWFNELAPSAYPRPQRLVGGWDPAQRVAVLAYLRAGQEHIGWRGFSHCRFACDVDGLAMGHRDYTDGTFVWPEGLPHYLEAHDVRLPDYFVAHALADPVKRPVPEDEPVDDDRWIAWGVAQGAAAILTGWDPLSWDDQRKVRARLRARLGGDHELWRRPFDIVLGRRATEELVLAIDDGRLAIVSLASGAVEWLPGWDAWPTGR